MAVIWQLVSFVTLFMVSVMLLFDDYINGQYPRHLPRKIKKQNKTDASNNFFGSKGIIFWKFSFRLQSPTFFQVFSKILMLRRT